MKIATEIVGIVFVIFAIWALFYGFTIYGVHHQVYLTEDSGVEFR